MPRELRRTPAKPQLTRISDAVTVKPGPGSTRRPGNLTCPGCSAPASAAASGCPRLTASLPSRASTSVPVAAPAQRATGTRERLSRRSASSVSSSPCVRDANRTSSRSSSSSAVSRPSAVAHRSRSATCSRSESEARSDDNVATHSSVTKGRGGWVNRDEAPEGCAASVRAPRRPRRPLASGPGRAQPAAEPGGLAGERNPEGADAAASWPRGPLHSAGTGTGFSCSAAAPSAARKPELA
jgi:hypothetical protein